MTEEIMKCLSCEDVVNEDDGFVFVKDGVLCYSCEGEDLERASRVLLVAADGTKQTVLVSTYRVVEAEYFEDFDEVAMSRTWHATDGWRGYFETELDGYEELTDLTGWTTGMPDESVSRKFDLNEWLERVFTEDVFAEVDFAIVTELTSNVFSTAVGVWVKEGQREAFLEWLNGDYEMLKGALG